MGVGEGADIRILSVAEVNRSIKSGDLRKDDAATSFGRHSVRVLDP